MTPGYYSFRAYYRAIRFVNDTADAATLQMVDSGAFREWGQWSAAERLAAEQGSEAAYAFVPKAGATPGYAAFAAFVHTGDPTCDTAKKWSELDELHKQACEASAKASREYLGFVRGTPNIGGW